jgi:hypothetical protein
VTGKVKVIMSLSAFNSDHDPDAAGLSLATGGSGEFCDWDEQDDDEDDDESPNAAIIAEITEAEARGSGWPGWSLDWSHPGLVIITTPSGRRYASTPEGESVALPRGIQQSHRRGPSA